jgi:peptidoglycan/LPS O-acetylase OafA/YrhL
MIRKKFNDLFFPHDNKVEHFKSLDGLRGVAVLFVLLSHSSNDNLFFHELFNFKHIGKVGVYLFFVLSAYLLDRQIALVFMTNKSSKRYWKNYCLRRFLRIYPLFIIALILHGLLTLTGFETVIDKITDFPAHMLLLRGESIFWSIPVEFKYYFISPLLMWFCHKYLKWDKLKLSLAFLVAIATSILIELMFNLPLISTFRYFPIFMIGTLLSIYELIISKEKIQNINPKIFNFFGLVGLALISVTIPFYFEKIFGYKVNFQSSIFYLPYALIWGVILLSAKYGNGIVKKILEFKFLRFIGSISFSMYLFHMLFLEFVKHIGLPGYVQIYVFFLLTIIFSSLSFLIIERPLSKIRIDYNRTTEKNSIKIL